MTITEVNFQLKKLNSFFHSFWLWFFLGISFFGFSSPTLAGQGVWSNVGTSVGNYPVSSILISQNGTLYIGTGALGLGGRGVFRYNTTSNQWENIVNNAGLTNTNVLSLVMDSTGRLYAGTEGGVFQYTPGAMQWQSVGGNLFVIDMNGFRLLLPPTFSSATVSKLLIHPTTGRLYAAAHDIYRYNPATDQWQKVGANYIRSTSLSLDPSSGNFYTGFPGAPGSSLRPAIPGVVYEYNQNTSQWIPIANNIDNVNYLLNSSTGILYAGRGGENRGGVYQYTPGTNLWQPIGLTTTHIFSLAFDASERLYAATSLGVFQHTSSTNQWQLLANNLGITNPKIHSIAFDSSGKLYAGAEGGNVFEIQFAGCNNNNICDSWEEINTCANDCGGAGNLGGRMSQLDGNGNNPASPSAGGCSLRQ